MTTNEERAADTEAIIRLIRHHADLLQATIDPDEPTLFDLSMAQFRTLLTIDHTQPATISELARRMGVGLPAASHLVDRLVTAGFVERADDPADRRRTIARLSPSGQALVDRFKHGPLHAVRAALGRLDAPTLRALRRGLEALVAAQQAVADEHRRERAPHPASDIREDLSRKPLHAFPADLGRGPEGKGNR
ncbi:MAG: MarR family transcriptional regulator [Chloroflexota bacterium]|nr:MarR family transcriptional regulator [Dehalococcoidia bacterium]MDW8255060.1 MarR family transcriptional regulator [Chloroflexota bacterium]